MHKRYAGKSFACKVRRFRADLVEDKVVEHLNTFLQQEGYLDGIDEKIRSGVGGDLGKAKESLRRVVAEIAKVESQIMSVFRLQTTMADGPGLELVKTQLDDLGTQKTKLKAQKEQLEGTVAELDEKSCLPVSTRGRILAFPTLWAKGTPSEQKRLLRTILQHLLPTEKSLQIFYWLNEDAEHQGNSKQSLFTSRNEKRDVDSKSASLVTLPVVPSVEIPAIVKNGVIVSS